MTKKEENQALVDAGLAKTLKEADGLRRRIVEAGQSTTQYIRANPQNSSFGPGGREAEAGGSIEMSELRALMNQEGLSYPEARVLRESLIRDGRSVQDYLASDAVSSMTGQETPTPLTVFRQAGKLIEMAGSKDKAVEAIEMWDKLSQ